MTLPDLRRTAESVVEALRDGGFALVTTSPGQQEAVADAFVGTLTEAMRVFDLGAPWRSDTFYVLGSPLPGKLLKELNESRDRLLAGGIRVVLVIGSDERRAFEEFAGDIASVLRMDEAVRCFRPSQLDATSARAECIAYWKSRFGRLDLRGLARSEREDVSEAVEDLYVDLFGTHSVLDDWDTSLPLTEHIDLLRRDGSPVYLVGPPGCGKSFFLRWVALGSPGWLHAERWVPILMSLSALVHSAHHDDLIEPIEDFLASQGLGVAAQLQDLASEGTIFFLLDGLDEVGDEATRSRVSRSVNELAARYPESPVVATSRPGGMDGLSDPRLVVSVDPLRWGQIREFLGKWCVLYRRAQGSHADDAQRLGQIDSQAL